MQGSGGLEFAASYNALGHNPQGKKAQFLTVTGIEGIMMGKYS
jgi:hypothetical protein